MFGYRFIKNVEIENLESNLKEANFVISENEKKSAELIEKINDQEKIIVKLIETANVSNQTEEKSDKPVKKVRRKNTNKNTKKEEQV